MSRVLIIGYGSPLRGDDNIGCHVARMLEEQYQDDCDVRVIGKHQLAPELAEDVAASEFVLFIDAAAGSPAGEIQQKAAKSRPGPLSFAHHLDPALLLAAALELYGNAPQAEVLTIVGADFELGDGLSPAVAQRLPELFAKACAIVELHRHRAVREGMH